MSGGHVALAASTTSGKMKCARQMWRLTATISGHRRGMCGSPVQMHHNGKQIIQEFCCRSIWYTGKSWMCECLDCIIGSGGVGSSATFLEVGATYVHCLLWPTLNVVTIAHSRSKVLNIPLPFAPCSKPCTDCHLFVVANINTECLHNFRSISSLQPQSSPHL